MFYSLINWARALSPGPLTVLMLPWRTPGACWDEAHGDALPPPPALLLPAPPLYSPCSIVYARLTARMYVCPFTPPGCVCPAIGVCVVGFPGWPEPTQNKHYAKWQTHFLLLRSYDLCLWCPIATRLSVHERNGILSHDYNVVTICNKQMKWIWRLDYGQMFFF